MLVVLVVKFLQLRFIECTLDCRPTPEAPSLSGCSTRLFMQILTSLSIFLLNIDSTQLKS